jgi:EAL domain-containing protein (putative c-di-GMP-specific phosphodiesterase class I)
MNIFLDSAVHLFKNLNIPIVIEGVETEEQLALTKTKGIEYVQGYFFSKPLTEDNLLDFLNEQKSNA